MAIGASAGGLRALQQLLVSLPDDTGMAFVVIVHLDPHHESRMAELLQAGTAMPVRQITRSLTAQPDHVYIIQPDTDLAMAAGELRSSARANGRRARSPIDAFFRTLAESHEADAIGVILSGTGADGTQGIRWIKERGGVTMAQEPADAEFDAMPRSAIATGQVDVVRPAAELGRELARIRRAASVISLPARGDALAGAESEAFDGILAHVRRATGQDFTGYKHATVMRRLERRMQFAGTADLAEYLHVLRDSPAETSTLFNDFLICVTSYFRDPDAFDALDREVVPALFADKGPEDDVRVWVAGCATGEEAYSLAILLTEYAEQQQSSSKVRIFATDVHERSFNFARDGLYPESIAADVSPARLERFFVREPAGYRVKKSLRECVLFATHDLLKDPPFLRLDLVSCRNVLIYLQRETQQRLLELFHRVLRPGGYLFLGSSETTDQTSRLFRTVDPRWHLYRSSSKAQKSPSHGTTLPSADARAPRLLETRGKETAASLAGLHQQLVEAHAPPSLVVTAGGDVVHLSARVGRYLRHPGGRPTRRLFDMVHGALRVELRVLLRAALRSGTPTSSRGVEVELDGKPRRVDLSVHPLAGNEGPATVALVVFDERRRARTPRSVRRTATAAESRRVASLDQLEEELKETRARLLATSEDHEATIKELRASNEELQSITEEQRVISEEVEASKEEVQSINEELRTINQEHRIRNEELAQLNSDLINLIDSTDIGTVFLDRELKVRRYTPPVTQIFNLAPTDIGRPLTDITHRLDFPDLEDAMGTVLRTLTRSDREVATDDGRWFEVRLSPYRFVDDRIDGVVLTLVDTTARKTAEIDRELLLRRVEEASSAKTNFIGAMSHEFRTPLNAILGYADILRDGAVGPLTADQQAKLERIADNARHLEHMVKEILDLARGDLVSVVLECETVEIVALLKEIARSIESLATAKGLALVLDLPSEATTVVTDPTKLHQIVVNLLGNAIRYTDRGQVTLRARIEGDALVLEVADTGIGIAAEHHEAVFERFWQVDKSHTRLRGGTGLGLMVVRDLTRALGGAVELTSELGKGSRFTVRLPHDSSPQRRADDRATVRR